MTTINMVTDNLTDFGFRELDMAGDLLKAFKSKKDDTKHFGDDGVHVTFNRNSGCVFLSDVDYNVAMMNGERLEDFFSCPQCGHEGFLEEMEHGEDSPDCQEYFKQINGDK